MARYRNEMFNYVKKCDESEEIFYSIKSKIKLKFLLVFSTTPYTLRVKVDYSVAHLLLALLLLFSIAVATIPPSDICVAEETEEIIS